MKRMLQAVLAGACVGAALVAFLRLLAPEVAVKEFLSVIGAIVLAAGLGVWWLQRPRPIITPAEATDAVAASTTTKVRRLSKRTRA